MHRVRTEHYGIYHDYDDEFEQIVKENEIIADYFSIKVIHQGVDDYHGKADIVWEGTQSRLEMLLTWFNRDMSKDDFDPEPVLSKRLGEIQKQWDEWQWPSDVNVIIPHPDTGGTS